MKFTRLKGFEDWWGEDLARREQMIARLREVLDRYGFSWILTPTLERTELFQRSVGEHTDIVEKEMFTFEDRGKRSVTLRPEGTAPVVRAVIEHRLQPPLRLAYVINNFRAEKPQKGRLREFWQIGAEIIGFASPLADVELIQLGVDLLNAARIPDWHLEIHSIGTPEERRAYREVLRSYLLPRKDQLCRDCQRRLDTNPLRVLDCKIDSPSLTDAPRLVEHLSPESRAFYDQVKEGLHRAGIPFQENPALVRGLDYYTHTVFEFKTPHLGAQDTLGGGGRYDRLVRHLGGGDWPALGFAFGLERLLLVSQLPPPDPRPPVWVFGVDEADLPTALQTAHKLRTTLTYPVQFYPDPRSLKARMRLANRTQAPAVVLIGTEERRAGQVRIRWMDSGEEQVLTLEAAVEALKRRLRSSREA